MINCTVFVTEDRNHVRLCETNLYDTKPFIFDLQEMYYIGMAGWSDGQLVGKLVGWLVVLQNIEVW